MNYASKFSLIGLFFILISCEFNQSVKTDLTTGAYSKGDGLKCDDVSIEINGEVEKRTTFIYGEQINFIFSNVTGFKKESEKVFPILTITIIKNEKDTIANSENLLIDLSEGTELSPLELSAHFMAGFQFETADEFVAQVNISDDKSDGTFYYELPFKVQENKLLNIDAIGLVYKDIYLWNESKKMTIAKGNIEAVDTVLLLIEGLDGFKEVDGKIFPICMLEFNDNNGEKVIYNPNLLQEYDSVGVDSEEFRNGQLPIILTFNEGVYYNPYSLNLVLSDKYSTNEISISAKLDLR